MIRAVVEVTLEFPDLPEGMTEEEAKFGLHKLMIVQLDSPRNALRVAMSSIKEWTLGLPDRSS